MIGPGDLRRDREVNFLEITLAIDTVVNIVPTLYLDMDDSSCALGPEQLIEQVAEELLFAGDV